MRKAHRPVLLHIPMRRGKVGFLHCVSEHTKIRILCSFQKFWHL